MKAKACTKLPSLYLAARSVGTGGDIDCHLRYRQTAGLKLEFLLQDFANEAFTFEAWIQASSGCNSGKAFTSSYAEI